MRNPKVHVHSPDERRASTAPRSADTGGASSIGNWSADDPGLFRSKPGRVQSGGSHRPRRAASRRRERLHEPDADAHCAGDCAFIFSALIFSFTASSIWSMVKLAGGWLGG